MSPRLKKDRDFTRDYREWLRAEMKKRTKRNPRYSLRAFARDMGVAPSRLSEVLTGKGHLSRESCQKICQALGLSKFESERFSDLVTLETEKDPHRRRALETKLGSGEAYEKFRLSKEIFETMSEWQHMAILELSTIPGFRSEPEWIAERLDLNPNLVNASIERLLRLKLLQKDNRGNLTAVEELTLSPDGISSQAVRQAHDGLLRRALTVLHSRPVQERNITNTMLTFDPEFMEEAATLIRDFRRTFKQRLPKPNKSQKLYSLAVQFFPLEKN